MRVTFPHMGNLHICAKALLEGLGMEVVVPPKSSKRTLTLGTLHSPEFACLPLKLNLGNFIEAHDQGADTIIMAGGVGPCRFGYYAQVQREILRDIGYDLHMIVLEPPENHVSELIRNIKQVTGKNSWWTIIQALRFAWKKVSSIDQVEKLVHKIRPRELQKGAATKIYYQFLTDIDAAQTDKDVKQIVSQTLSLLHAIPADWDKEVLRIGLVGEIYVLLEPFVNLNIEKHLGEMGVEVVRSIYLSEWVNEHLFMGLLRHVNNSKHARKSAYPYIKHFVGGHGQDTVGHTVIYAQEGFNGVIQLAPFTCMPEIVAESVLPRVNKDLGIPTLSLVLDEHGGEAGVVTRLEAFVDLLSRSEMQQQGGIR